jgi:8-oxo-dGTP pyrophosphatase MutT (NUDIX family)
VPVEAATVILTRPVPDGEGWQCFMVRRPALSDFAADVYVFPGGKVDPADRESSGESRPLPQTGDDLLPFRIAAIRELFEEAGVLLAYDEAGSVVRFGADSERRFESARQRVHAGEISVLELARLERVVLAVDRLSPISRWITPESYPRRFDTYFFITELPDGQEPLPHAAETVGGVWVEPRIALDRFRRGEFPLVFATEKHLERLANCASPSDAALGARLEPVMPRPVRRGGKTEYLVPGDEGCA